MDRYITRRYVAICWADAVRLAQLDGTALEDIRYQSDVALLHRTEWWAWWSDERLTTAIGLPEVLSAEGLSTDAIALINDVWMSDLLAPECGWALLAKVVQIVACEKILLSDFFTESFSADKLTLLFIDGTQGTFYRCFYGNGDCCECNVIAL